MDPQEPNLLRTQASGGKLANKRLIFQHVAPHFLFPPSSTAPQTCSTNPLYYWLIMATPYSRRKPNAPSGTRTPPLTSPSPSQDSPPPAAAAAALAPLLPPIVLRPLLPGAHPLLRLPKGIPSYSQPAPTATGQHALDKGGATSNCLGPLEALQARMGEGRGGEICACSHLPGRGNHAFVVGALLEPVPGRPGWVPGMLMRRVHESREKRSPLSVF